MDAEKKARWSEIRARGRARFILTEGVLRVGLLYAALLFLLRYFFKYGFTASGAGEYLRGGEPIFQFIFDCLAFGYIMGWLDWREQEREFKRAEQDETEKAGGEPL